MPPHRIKDAVADLPVPLRDAAYRAWGLAHGQWPTALGDIVQPWLTRNPVTFNEKVRRRIATDRRPILATFADKLLARDYAAARIDPELLLPLLATGRHAADIDWHALPREYACKVNHASGGVIIVSDAADPTTELPHDPRRVEWRRYLVHPDQAHPERLAALADHWLAMPYRRHAGAYPEWAYRHIDRRILVETYWGGPHGLPREMAIPCIDGVPRSISLFVHGPDVQHEDKRRFLFEEGALAAADAGLDDAEWEQVAQASQALAAGTDMVRIDWIVGSGGARLGELSVYPAAGQTDFAGHDRLSAEEFDAVLSAGWSVP